MPLPNKSNRDYSAFPQKSFVDEEDRADVGHGAAGFAVLCKMGLHFLSFP